VLTKNSTSHGRTRKDYSPRSTHQAKAIDDCEARWLVEDLQNSIEQKLKKGDIELNRVQIESLGTGAISLAGMAVISVSPSSFDSIMKAELSEMKIRF